MKVTVIPMRNAKAICFVDQTIVQIRLGFHLQLTAVNQKVIKHYFTAFIDSFREYGARGNLARQTSKAAEFELQPSCSRSATKPRISNISPVFTFGAKIQFCILGHVLESQKSIFNFLIFNSPPNSRKLKNEQIPLSIHNGVSGTARGCEKKFPDGFEDGDCKELTLEGTTVTAEYCYCKSELCNSSGKFNNSIICISILVLVSYLMK